MLREQQWNEDEDVLDAWDAEEEDKEDKIKKEAPPKAKPVDKKVEKKASTVATAPANETDAERRARLDKLIKERDLESAMELFGISGKSVAPATSGSATSSPSKQTTTSASPVSSFETASPESMAEFDQFSRLISRKLETLEGHRYYPQFLEGLVNTLVGRREAPEIRKISGVLANMATLRAKQAKTTATRGPSTAGAPAAVALKSMKPSKGSGRFDDCFAGYDDDDGFGE